MKGKSKGKRQKSKIKNLRCLLVALGLTSSLGCSNSRQQGKSAPPLFREVAAETGLAFSHFTGAILGSIERDLRVVEGGGR